MNEHYGKSEEIHLTCYVKEIVHVVFERDLQWRIQTLLSKGKSDNFFLL